MAATDPKVRAMMKLDEPSGFNKFLKLRFGEVTGTLVTAELEVTEDHLQPTGIVHGGIYTSVVETLPSVGGSLWLDGKGYCVGVHNSTHFFRPTGPGVTLRAVATPVQQGKSQQLWRVEIKNEQDKLVSVGELRVHNIYFGEGEG